MHNAFMALALAQARQSLTLSNPNPRVGCVIVDDEQRVIGQGHTQAAGGAHAEIMALRDAAARSESVRGATAYVTLEPCAHQGRTGPCCDALVAAGIGAVVASVQDPNPRVAGQGFERLRAAGITVTVGPGAAESHDLNIGFFSRMQRGRPWVRMKVAASLDGQTALMNGASQWITGPAARADGHAWRARSCAVLTGVGTVLADDPMLNVRLSPEQGSVTRQPHLVIVDSRLQTPPIARLWQTTEPPRQVWLYHAQPNATPQAAVLAPHGAQLRSLPNAHGKVDLAAMLDDLGRRGVNELHVEAGTQLNGSLLATGLVDELLVYMAPKLVGQGRGISNLGPFDTLSDALPYAFSDVTRVGDDLRIMARQTGAHAF